MKKHKTLRIVILSGIFILAAACTPPPAQTEETATPIQVTALPTEEPTEVPPPTNTPIPPTEEPTESPPPKNAYAPQPGDEDLNRSPAFVENSSLSVMPVESGGISISVQLAGNLPTPCNQLRVEVAPVNELNEIQLTVYSLTDPDEACMTVIQEYTAEVDLGEFPEGTYTILANGLLIGETGSPGETEEGENNMVRAPITIQEQGLDFDAARVPSAIVQLVGFLPTPCHEFHVDINEPNDANEIHLDVYSLVDPGQNCITVVEEFNEAVELGEYPAGNYRVLVNGVDIGGFEIP